MTASPSQLTPIQQDIDRYLDYADLIIEFTPGRTPVYISEETRGEKLLWEVSV